MPKLTGATAEVINMWLWLCVGKEPFFLDEKGRVNLRFQPILAKWLFTKEGMFSFNFLGKIRVIYTNLKRKNTFGKNGVKPVKIKCAGKTFTGGSIPALYTEKIRNREIEHIQVILS